MYPRADLSFAENFLPLAGNTGERKHVLTGFDHIYVDQPQSNYEVRGPCGQCGPVMITY